MRAKRFVVIDEKGNRINIVTSYQRSLPLKETKRGCTCEKGNLPEETLLIHYTLRTSRGRSSGSHTLGGTFPQMRGRKKTSNS